MNMHQKMEFLIHIAYTYTKKTAFCNMRVTLCIKKHILVGVYKGAVWN